MYRATYEGQLLTMAFIIFYGPEAAYHYGASTELARQIPGAYAVQWEAIQEARRRGCMRYNFWGVTEHGHTKHRFYGVSVFKRGFGGEDVAYLPARDLIIDPLRYPLTYVFETARRKLRGCKLYFKLPQLQHEPDAGAECGCGLLSSLLRGAVVLGSPEVRQVDVGIRLRQNVLRLAARSKRHVAGGTAHHSRCIFRLASSCNRHPEITWRFRCGGE